MKRLSLILIGIIALIVSSCNKTGMDYHQTLFIASVKNPLNGYYAKIIGQEKLKLETHDAEDYGSLWFEYNEPIIGFDSIYEEGYEYIIDVKVTSPNRTFTLEGLVMKNKADTFVDPSKVQRVIFE